MCSKAEEPTYVQEMFNRSGEQAVLILKSFVRYLDRIIFALVHKLYNQITNLFNLYLSPKNQHIQIFIA